MTPLDAREWLEAQRLAGNPFARELLEMLDEQDHLSACEDIVTDLKKKAPADLVKKWDKANEPWRLVEWFGDREALLAEVEEVTAEHSEGVDWPNGTKPGDVAEQLRTMFMSPRWLQYDL